MPTAERTRAAAVLMLLGAALLWSLGGVLIKWVAWHPLAIAGVRSLVAAPALLFMMRRRPRLGRGWAPWATAAAYAGTVITLVAATRLTTAANAILLQYTGPIYVALLAPLLLGEPTSRRDWLLVALSLGGIALFFLDRLSPAGLWGNLVGLASGMFFGCLIMLLRYQGADDPLEAVVLGNLLAGLVCLPWVGPPWPGAGDWLVLGVLGVVQLALPYYLYVKAIARVTALESVLITTVEPILNPLWVALFLGELPGPWAVGGGVLVLAAVTTRGVLTARGEGEGRHA